MLGKQGLPACGSWKRRWLQWRASGGVPERQRRPNPATRRPPSGVPILKSLAPVHEETGKCRCVCCLSSSRPPVCGARAKSPRGCLTPWRYCARPARHVVPPGAWDTHVCASVPSLLPGSVRSARLPPPCSLVAQPQALSTIPRPPRAGDASLSLLRLAPGACEDARFPPQCPRLLPSGAGTRVPPRRLAGPLHTHLPKLT